MYKINIVFIFIINFMYVFRGITVKLGISNLIYILSLITIVVNLLILLGNLKNLKISNVIGFLFIGFMILIYSIFIVPLKVSLIGFVALFINLSFWFLFFVNVREETMVDFFSFYLRINVIFAILTAISGIYQYFIDPSLMGFAIHDIYGNPELMTSGMFVRRVTGLMGSPQNYSLYMGIMTCLLFYLDWSLKYKYSALIILLVGGALSGSRTYISILLLSIIIVALIKLVNKKKNLDKLLISSIVSFITFPLIYGVLHLRGNISNRTFGRMFTFFSDWPALKVFQNYLYTLDFGSFLLGKGLGFNERVVAQFLGNQYYSIFGTTYSSYESYILSILMQLGVFGVIGFLLIYISSLKKSYKLCGSLYFAVLIGILINALFTPSFNGLAMSFIIWPLILYPTFIKVEIFGEKSDVGISYN